MRQALGVTCKLFCLVPRHAEVGSRCCLPYCSSWRYLLQQKPLQGRCHLTQIIASCAKRCAARFLSSISKKMPSSLIAPRAAYVSWSFWRLVRLAIGDSSLLISPNLPCVHQASPGTSSSLKNAVTLHYQWLAYLSPGLVVGVNCMSTMLFKSVKLLVMSFTLWIKDWICIWPISLLADRKPFKSCKPWNYPSILTAW